jgi:hypothetical protein
MAWMFVFCVCCVGNGLCDELIMHWSPTECVCVCVSNVCDLETPATQKPEPSLGCCTTEKKRQHDRPMWDCSVHSKSVLAYTLILILLVYCHISNCLTVF